MLINPLVNANIKLTIIPEEFPTFPRLVANPRLFPGQQLLPNSVSFPPDGSTVASSLLGGPCDNLFDKSSADDFKVFNDSFSVHSKNNFFRPDARLRYATRYVRHLHSK